MEHVGVTEQLFGESKMELNTYFYLVNIVRRV